MRLQTVRCDGFDEVGQVLQLRPHQIQQQCLCRVYIGSLHTYLVSQKITCSERAQVWSSPMIVYCGWLHLNLTCPVLVSPSTVDGLVQNEPFREHLSLAAKSNGTTALPCINRLHPEGIHHQFTHLMPVQRWLVDLFHRAWLQFVNKSGKRCIKFNIQNKYNNKNKKIMKCGL